MIESRYRHSYSSILAELRKRLKDAAPGKIQVLSGPRQVGKTTLLTQLAEEWGDRSVYVAADATEASIPGWWDLIWKKVEDVAATGPAVIFLDEIQYQPEWSRKLKSKSDHLARKKMPLHVVVSGSSSLQLSHGTRETMAGRFESLRLLHWPADELVRHFGLDENEAVKQVVQYGSYPGAVSLLPDPVRWRDYVRHSIVEPAIGRDILMMEAIRKPALLRQVFAVAAGHPAEIVSLQKICGQLGERGALETVAHYLRVLEDACLVASVDKYSGQILRQRSSPPKLVALNQGIIAAMSDKPPTAESEPERWGRWVENACLAHAWNAGQQIYYWREEPLEVDMVIDGSWGKWAVEVKTGNYSVRDLSGMLEFCRRHSAYRPMLLCRNGDESIARDAGVDCISWESFLLKGIS